MVENRAATNESDNTARTQRLGELAERDFDLVFLLRQYDETGRDKPDLWLTMIHDRIDRQVIRRIYVRLLMSFVESVIATMKSELMDDIYELTPAETAALTDTTYDVTDQGEAIERPAFVSIHKSVRFVFRFYAYVYNLEVSPQFGDEGWQAFRETIAVRNRITHPKSVDEMTIADTEMARVDQAHDWFIQTYRLLLDAHVEKLRQFQIGRHQTS